MITLRPSESRGHADHGWLKTRHSFSFGDYHDPRHMSFRSLRVLNEDHIAGGAGFPTHPHRDMEIITYVVSGAVAHRDSTGGEGVIRAGELQHMTAGSGVRHSEFNASPTEPAHLLQIWIVPEKEGLTPGYTQTSSTDPGLTGVLALAAARDGTDGVLRIHQDVQLYIGNLRAGNTVNHELGRGRHAWLQLISGALAVNEQALSAGDAVAVSEESTLCLRAVEAANLTSREHPVPAPMPLSSVLILHPGHQIGLRSLDHQMKMIYSSNSTHAPPNEPSLASPRACAERLLDPCHRKRSPPGGLLDSSHGPWPLHTQSATVWASEQRVISNELCQ